MADLYIKTNDLYKWLRKYFPKKDLITIDELINLIDTLDGEVEHLKEQLEDVIQDRDDNWRRLRTEEQIGRWN